MINIDNYLCYNGNERKMNLNKAFKSFAQWVNKIYLSKINFYLLMFSKFVRTMARQLSNR